jgi:hypothetical protein
MDTMTPILPPVNNRFAALTTEELVSLSQLDLASPKDGIDRHPADWPTWCDNWHWEPSDHTYQDEQAAALLFADDAVTEVDNGPPPMTWVPSRVSGLEPQQAGGF